MSISPKLIPVLWFAVAVVVLSGIGLGVGITLLLSKVSHRQVALPLVWTSAALLIAAVTALLVILIHA